MSAFLGKIHFWLYRKIQLVNEREALVLEKARASVGDLADELHETAVDTYGESIPADAPLDQVIDTANIHGWLQGQIEQSTVREASFIKDLLDCAGDEAIEPVLAAFMEQGMACGAVARDQLPEETASTIYDVMQNFYLNGMPCDGNDDVVENTEDVFTWGGDHRNQRGNWAKAGVDPRSMMAAYQAWFTGFVTAISPRFEFLVLPTESGVPNYSIVKKA